MIQLNDDNLVEQPPRETRSTLPKLPFFSRPTILSIQQRRFFVYSPSTILKLDVDDGEITMTTLARSILGPCVPLIELVIEFPQRTTDISTLLPVRQGAVLTLQPGAILSELWPSLTTTKRKTVKENLRDLLLIMRTRRFSYYGRPSRQPYVIAEGLGIETQVYCVSRSEWDQSRIRALHAADQKPESTVSLEKVQRETTGPDGWDRPVLSHMDLSERNILVDPDSLEVTGFLDWETSCIMPAYCEYIDARLSGGHQPQWRKELLDVLRSVLYHECDAVSSNSREAEERYNKTLAAWDAVSSNSREAEERYNKTLAAWDAVLNVERIAQGYGDNCYWTFENDLLEVSQRIGPVL